MVGGDNAAGPVTFKQSSTPTQKVEYERGITDLARKKAIAHQDSGQRLVDDMREHNYLTLAVSNFMKRGNNLAEVADVFGREDRNALKASLEKATPNIRLRETVLAFFDEHTASEAHRKHADECNDQRIGFSRSTSRQAGEAKNRETVVAAMGIHKERSKKGVAGLSDEQWLNHAKLFLKGRERDFLALALQAGFDGSLVRRMSVEWGIHPPAQTPVINQSAIIMQQFAENLRKLLSQSAGTSFDYGYLKRYDDEKEQRKIAKLLEGEFEGKSPIAMSMGDAVGKGAELDEVIMNAARVLNALCQESGVRPDAAITVLNDSGDGIRTKLMEIVVKL